MKRRRRAKNSTTSAAAPQMFSQCFYLSLSIQNNSQLLGDANDANIIVGGQFSNMRVEDSLPIWYYAMYELFPTIIFS